RKWSGHFARGQSRLPFYTSPSPCEDATFRPNQIFTLESASLPLPKRPGALAPKRRRSLNACAKKRLRRLRQSDRSRQATAVRSTLARYLPPRSTCSMRALIVANGDPPSAELLNTLAARAALVVAADAGLDKALAAGLHVDAVVGDFDSVSAEGRAQLPPEAFHHDAALDSTDLEKAVAFCIEHGCDTVDVAAASGGRA